MGGCLLILILVTLCGLKCESWEPNGSTWKFVDVHSHAVSVSDISPDLSMPGYLIFSQPTSLNTTNGVDWKLLAGGNDRYGFKNGAAKLAQFRTITSFVQLSAKRVLLADQFNHCIRELNRETGRVSTFIGLCELSGYKDGASSVALFSHPQDLELNEDNVYVADFRNHVVRLINLAEKIVSTLISSDSGLRLPLAIVYGHSKLHVSNLSGLVEFNMGSDEPAWHDMNDLYSWKRPQKLLKLGPDHLAVADGRNDSVILLNQLTDQITKICEGKGRVWVDGPVDNCKLYGPTSLAYMDGVLYIGGYGGIRGTHLIMDYADGSFYFSRQFVDKNLIIGCVCGLLLIAIIAMVVGIVRRKCNNHAPRRNEPVEMDEIREPAP